MKHEEPEQERERESDVRDVGDAHLHEPPDWFDAEHRARLEQRDEDND